jgi:hypothetical protein
LHHIDIPIAIGRHIGGHIEYSYVIPALAMQAEISDM